MPPLRYWSPIMEDAKLEQTAVSSSMLSMLPTSLQSRLPPLRSIRRSVSMQTLQTTTPTAAPDSRNPPHGPTRPLFGIDTVPTTPPSKPADKFAADPSDRTPPPEYPSTPIAEEPLDPLASCSQSGIAWRYAQQGLSLLHVAQAESRHPLSRNASGPALERQAFVDGAEYILKSLPDDMTESELKRLRASAPLGLASCSDPSGSCSHNHPDHDSPCCGPGRRPGRRYHGDGSHKSALHRIVQSAVAQLIVLVHLALPYVILLLRLAARTEREYNVSQNMIATGVGLANTIGTHGVRVTSGICSMGDGRVGKAMGDAVAWAVEGVTGGFTDGVGQGLSIVGLPYKGPA